MARYITEADSKHFQPMNVNFGLFPALGEKIRSKQERGEKHAERALASIEAYIESEKL